MLLKELFGKKLKEIRKQKGFTQEELAELCDMQTNSIGMIETGQRAVSFSTIETIASCLQVDYIDLFDFNNVYKSEYSKDKAFCNIYKLAKKFDSTTMQHLVEYTRLLKKLIKQKSK